MKAVFFELEGWEAPELRRALEPMGLELELHSEVLGPSHLPGLRDCAILSPFIYSKLTSLVLDHAPGLKFIATRSTGFDHVDLAWALRKAVPVSNVPEYGSNTVA